MFKSMLSVLLFAPAFVPSAFAQGFDDQALIRQIQQQEAEAQAHYEQRYVNKVVIPAYDHLTDPTTYGANQDGTVPDTDTLAGVRQRFQNMRDRVDRAAEIATGYADQLTQDFQQGVNDFTVGREPQSVPLPVAGDLDGDGYRDGPKPSFQNHGSSYSSNSFDVGGSYSVGSSGSGAAWR